MKIKKGRPKVRPDCKWCHGQGFIRYHHVGEKIPKGGVIQNREPCFCIGRQTAPMNGKAGRRQSGPFPVGYRGREGKGRKELTRAEKIAAGFIHWEDR